MSRYLLLVALATLPAAAAAQTQDSLPEGVTPQMIQAGDSLYGGAGICLACHGPGARGVANLGPNLTDEEWLQIDGSYDAIVEVILAGVPADKSKSGLVMPPNGGSALTEEQVRAVAAYVWSRRFSSDN